MTVDDLDESHPNRHLNPNHSNEFDEDQLLLKWEQRFRNLTQSLHFFSCNILGHSDGNINCYIYIENLMFFTDYLGGGNINEGYDQVANVLVSSRFPKKVTFSYICCNFINFEGYFLPS